MTKEQAKEMMPIIKAYSEGKTIEYKTLCNMDFNTNTDNYYYEAE